MQSRTSATDWGPWRGAACGKSTWATSKRKGTGLADDRERMGLVCGTSVPAGVQHKGKGHMREVETEKKTELACGTSARPVSEHDMREGEMHASGIGMGGTAIAHTWTCHIRSKGQTKGHGPPVNHLKSLGRQKNL